MCAAVAVVANHEVRVYSFRVVSYARLRFWLSTISSRGPLGCLVHCGHLQALCCGGGHVVVRLVIGGSSTAVWQSLCRERFVVSPSAGDYAALLGTCFGIIVLQL